MVLQGEKLQPFSGNHLAQSVFLVLSTYDALLTQMDYRPTPTYPTDPTGPTDPHGPAGTLLHVCGRLIYCISSIQMRVRVCQMNVGVIAKK
jgi:hypothetical protein